MRSATIRQASDVQRPRGLTPKSPGTTTQRLSPRARNRCNWGNILRQGRINNGQGTQDLTDTEESFHRILGSKEHASRQQASYEARASRGVTRAHTGLQSGTRPLVELGLRPTQFIIDTRHAVYCAPGDLRCARQAYHARSTPGLSKRFHNAFGMRRLIERLPQDGDDME